ncbi:MAG: DUF6588 family protein [Chitinispirillaceae bacterium]
MKTKYRIIAGILATMVSSSLAGPIGETVKAFERRPQYVLPFATLLGEMTNSGWYQSASVDRLFGYNFSLPISLVYIGGKDRAYSGTYVDPACIQCREQASSNASIESYGCKDRQDYTAPTIFGTIRTPVVYKYVIGLDYSVIDSLQDPTFSDGIEQLSNLSLLPFVTLQAGLSYYYTELKLRYLGMPSIGGISVHLPGFGIQHDFQYLLPDNLPVSLSLAANFTFLNVKWEPGDDVTGTLSLSGLTNFLGVIGGYKLRDNIEVFLETGWQHSYMKPSGTLDVDGDIVEPTETITGRNAFKAALNVGFALGYHPVLGGTAGADFANTINILSYKSKGNDK